MNEFTNERTHKDHEMLASTISDIAIIKRVSQNAAVIKVMGVGGAGGNAIADMMAADVQGIELYNANTDLQDLYRVNCPNQIQIGVQETMGLGAGADPSIGEKAARENKDELKNAIEGANMLFIAAGMGGGTGTGAAPVVAEISKEMGILTVAVVSMPCEDQEGPDKYAAAEHGLNQLKQFADCVICIYNSRLYRQFAKLPIHQLLNKGNEILHKGVTSISDLMVMQGLQNVDFADVRNVLKGRGTTKIGVGLAKGQPGVERAAQALANALENPLFDQIPLHSAEAILINISGADVIGEESSYINKAMRDYQLKTNDPSLRKTHIFGTCPEHNEAGELKLTVIVAGIHYDIGKPNGQDSSLQNGQQSIDFSANAAVIENRAADVTSSTQPTAPQAFDYKPVIQFPMKEDGQVDMEAVSNQSTYRRYLDQRAQQSQRAPEVARAQALNVTTQNQNCANDKDSFNVAAFLRKQAD